MYKYLNKYIDILEYTKNKCADITTKNFYSHTECDTMQSDFEFVMNNCDVIIFATCEYEATIILKICQDFIDGIKYRNDFTDRLVNNLNLINDIYGNSFDISIISTEDLAFCLNKLEKQNVTTNLNPQTLNEFGVTRKSSDEYENVINQFKSLSDQTIKSPIPIITLDSLLDHLRTLQ